MSQHGATAHPDKKEPKLPTRDWFILPILSLLTVLTMGLGTEVVAHFLFPKTTTEITDCLIYDPATGVRGKPNSVCLEKLPETPLTTYRFNSCGHRAGYECGNKPPGTYRIVLTGSSIAMGARVAQDKTFAALLPPVLTHISGHPIQIYNEGMSYGTPHDVLLRFPEIIAAKPDLILWVLTSRDVELSSELLPPKEDPKPKSLIHRLIGYAKDSRTAVLLAYYMYKSPTSYAKLYIVGANAPNYLRANFNRDWQNHLIEFDGYAAQIEGKANAAHIPFAAVFVPSRVHAAVLSMKEQPAGFDPYKLDREVRAIIEKHGGTYIDILPDFSLIPGSEEHYYPTDGHPDAAGQAMISALLAKQLTAGAIPQLRPNNQTLLSSAKSPLAGK
ncbi:MAG: SGNH/GDSL hydrolase family protein [Acidobacteria bacterium]|nr:SGNH/GDSL hydrolase family protein [Acidobacteriota bacterium]